MQEQLIKSNTLNLLNSDTKKKGNTVILGHKDQLKAYLN